MTRICIAGKNEIAVFAVDYIAEKFPSLMLCVLPNSSDDGFDGWQPSLLAHAARLNIETLTLEDCYAIEDLVFISLEYDQIIKPEKFSTNRLFNLHFSNLPAYKGMFTSAWPILRSESLVGVTLHCLDEGIDTGDIIAKQEFQLNPSWTARHLYFEYMQRAKNLFAKNVDALINDTYETYSQSYEGASYFSRLSLDYSDVTLDAKKTAWEVVAQVKAFNFFEYQLPRIHDYFIRSAEVFAKRTLRAGAIVAIDPLYIIVSTIDFDVKLNRCKNYELLSACSVGDLARAKECLNHGANVNIKNGSSWTPLIIASFNGFTDLISLLLGCGAEIDMPNKKGTTPIMYAMTHAAETGNYLAFDILKKSGAEFTITDHKGLTIYDYAKKYNVKI